jgi:hypothetical protein
MQPLKTIIDHKLRVRVRHLPEGALFALCEALSIPNIEKAKAKKLDQWGWQRMPDHIEMFSFEIDSMTDDTWLVMPRGFLGDYAAGMQSFGYEVELQDRRSHAAPTLIDYGGEGWRIHPWQREQMEAIEPGSKASSSRLRGAGRP